MKKLQWTEKEGSRISGPSKSKTMLGYLIRTSSRFSISQSNFSSRSTNFRDMTTMMSIMMTIMGRRISLSQASILTNLLSSSNQTITRKTTLISARKSPKNA